VKRNLKISIIFITIILFISQVNSVYNKKEFSLFISKNILNEKYICKKEFLDISLAIKQKHIQEMSLSCEISATADILSFLLSKKISEKELLKKLNKSDYNKFPHKEK
jgi:hypothetical protein